MQLEKEFYVVKSNGDWLFGPFYTKQAAVNALPHNSLFYYGDKYIPVHVCGFTENLSVHSKSELTKSI